MSDNLASEFDSRQYMSKSDYEIFYFNDLNLHHVSQHKHSHYEIYYFLEGQIEYTIEDEKITLKPGDILLMPPGVKHSAKITDSTAPYRRIVLWLSKTFIENLKAKYTDIYYGYQHTHDHQTYKFSFEFTFTNDIHWKLIELIEEIRSSQIFHDISCELKIAELMVFINRLLYEDDSESINEKPLFIKTCEYIDHHLEDNLSLQLIADEFFVTKYHLAHVFKDNIGIGVHQYINKKRLQSIKRAIPSGLPISELAEKYGFNDYTSFFRAFKKEFQLSPKEYKDQITHIDTYENQF